MKRLLLLAALALPTATAAQSPSSCTYEACALRIVDGGGYFGAQMVVRGREGYSVAYVRRSDALEDLFAVNDSASAYYAKFEVHDRYADWLGWLGTGLMLTGFVVDVFGDGGLFSKSFLLYGSGLAVTYGVALPNQRMGFTDLSSAIWWYNQALVRSP